MFLFLQVRTVKWHQVIILIVELRTAYSLYKKNTCKPVKIRSIVSQSQAQRVKGFINNNYREDLERKRSLAKEEKVPNRPTAKVPDVSTPLHGYTQPPVRHFTKLSYAWCSRINYPYKTHQSFLYFLLSAYTFALCTRRFGFKKIL